jgi:predicted outer membrane repeat protein
VSSHLRRYRRGQRLAAGAVLASSALFAPYLLALRPMVSYASQRTDRSQLSPRAIVPGGFGACSWDDTYFTTVTNDAQLQAAVVAAQDDTVICIANTDDSITLSQTLQIDDTTITLVGADDTAVLFKGGVSDQRHIQISRDDTTSPGTDDTVTILNLTFKGDGNNGGIESYAGAPAGLSQTYVVLQDDTFMDNYTSVDGEGGGVYHLYGALTISNSNFLVNGSRHDGGAVTVGGARVEIVNSYFKQNYSSDRGGAVFADLDDTLVVRGSTFRANYVDHHGSTNNCQGGALYLRTGSAHLSDVTFEDNLISSSCRNDTRYSGGGAVSAQRRSTIVIDGSSTFTHNYSNDDTTSGGSIFMGYESSLTIDGATFEDDSAAYAGGSIFMDDTATLVVSDTTFDGSRAGGAGGAIFLKEHSTLSLDNSVLTRNFAVQGGAIYAYGQVSIANSALRANVAGDGGGAIRLESQSDDTSTIRSSLFFANEADRGGSVFWRGHGYSLAVWDSVFRDDSVSDHGGSITLSGYGSMMTMDRTSVVGARARSDGGGIYSTQGTELAISNSTLFDNTAGERGGAIFSAAAHPSLALSFSTVTGNSADDSGGAIYSDDTISLINSVVSDNTTAAGGRGDDVYFPNSPSITVRNSFFTRDDSVSLYGPAGTRSNLLFGDPLLGNLGDNGGSYVGATGDDTFIPTQLPAAGSPLIGAGLLNLISPAVTVDQVGNSRVQSAFPNQTTIGALFRALPNPTPPTPSNPPSAPRDVTATGGDASATVTWTAPASAGSFPITNYRATAAPGGASCLVLAPATTCRVEKLTNGTTYTFTVAALNGAGWGAESAPSNAVTPEAPTPPVEKSIVITGTRGTGNDNRTIYVAGTTTGLTGTVEPHYRFPGGQYTLGNARPAITDDGTFTWKRRSGKKTYVFFTHGEVKSNRVIIAAR